MEEFASFRSLPGVLEILALYGRHGSTLPTKTSVAFSKEFCV